MGRRYTLTLLSDIHYAGPGEQARGDDLELANLRNPILRLPLQAYRKLIWLKHPTRQNGQLDRLLAEAPDSDYVVANGDYPCGSAWLGLSDDATFESAQICVGRLRERYGDRLRLTIGDHELGKASLLGDRGGLRLASLHRATDALGLQPFWQLELGNYLLMGVTSTLIELPLFEQEMLAEEHAAWEERRQQQLAAIRAAFAALLPRQRVLLFCHDPSALPFLGREPAVRERLQQIEQTVVGHLHSRLFLWQSRLLAGMPVITFMGHNVRRMSRALNEARQWKPFRVRLCPSLAGIELLKDGGYFTVELDATASTQARWRFHPLPR